MILKKVVKLEVLLELQLEVQLEMYSIQTRWFEIPISINSELRQ